MTTIEIKDASGKKAGTAEALTASVFGISERARHAPGCARAACVLAPGHA